MPPRLSTVEKYLYPVLKDKKELMNTPVPTERMSSLDSCTM